MKQDEKTNERVLQAMKGMGGTLGSGSESEAPKSTENQSDGVMVDQNTSAVAPKKDNRKHPDPAVAQTVAGMVFAGQSQDTICRVLKMSMSTLYQHYKYELDTGQASMVNDISTSLAQRARAGSDTAAIFLLKTRGGGKFTERNALELTGKDGGPIEIAQRTEILQSVNGLLRKGITIEGEVEPLD